METPMLITDEQRATMLANGRSYATNPAFDPHPVVKLFDPLGGGTWLLTDLDPADEDIAGGSAISAWAFRKSAPSGFRNLKMS